MLFISRSWMDSWHCNLVLAELLLQMRNYSDFSKSQHLKPKEGAQMTMEGSQRAKDRRFILNKNVKITNQGIFLGILNVLSKTEKAETVQCLPYIPFLIICDATMAL